MLFIIEFYSHTVTMSLSDRERPYGFSPLSSTGRTDTCTFHRASEFFNDFPVIKQFLKIIEIRLLGVSTRLILLLRDLNSKRFIGISKV